MRFCLIACLTLLITSPSGDNDSTWSLRKSEQGITVYTKTHEDNGLKVFRGITEVESSLSSLIALMKSIEDGPNWIYNCTEAKVLETESLWEEYIYFRSHVRWPFRDRDAVMHTKLSQDPDSKIVTITMKGLPNYIDETKNVIRMPVMEGFWQLVPVEGKVIVTYEMMCDAGKGIPDFLANASLIDYPFETLLNLKERVKADEYQNALFEALPGIEQ